MSLFTPKLYKGFLGFRRLPNLGEQLTSAKIQYQPIENKEAISRLKICSRLGKYKYCPLIKKVSEIRCDYTKETFKLRNLPKIIIFELSNVIYTITCSKCTMVYTGKTGCEMRKRIYEHLLSAKKPEESWSTPVSRHFTSDNHTHPT